MVDHVHFQYNGFLSGMYLLSLTYLQQGSIIKSGFFFAVLLNFKHIYLYVAPAYFIYMLRQYLKIPYKLSNIDMKGLIRLGGVVMAVFALSFGPFLSQIPQIISRLFPVQRGLCHAYWAPNFWTLYNIGDVISGKILSKIGWIAEYGRHPVMSGLVQVSEFVVLPNITPVHTAILTLVSASPALVKLFNAPNLPNFFKTSTLTAFSSYMFGYHVHEKAVLVILIPYGVLLFHDKLSAKLYFFLSLVGTYSLFPLLFQLQELSFKPLIFCLVHTLLHTILQLHYGEIFLSSMEKCYLFSIPLHFVLVEIFLPLFVPQLQFLPLLLYSVFCSAGFIYNYISLYANLLQN